MMSFIYAKLCESTSVIYDLYEEWLLAKMTSMVKSSIEPLIFQKIFALNRSILQPQLNTL